MVCDPRTQREDSFTVAVKDALNQLLADHSICLPKSSPLLIAFSGGPDSTALLAALISYAEEYDLRLHVCHINHGLRGDESDGDEEFCRQLCEKWGLQLHVEKLESPGHSEADLRKCRYERLAHVAMQVGAPYCFTGHTLDDQVETMLFRLFRGTGPSGLIGIPPYRKVSTDLAVLRPMLGISRIDCLRYLARKGVSARFDSSNEEDVYSRNYIRNQIFPLIEKRFPGYRDRMEQFRKVIEADDSLLNCLSHDALVQLADHSGNRDLWLLDEFNELPLSLRRRVLYESLRQREIEYDFARIEALLEMIDLDGDSAVCLNEEWEIRLNRGQLHWNNKLDKPEVPELGNLSIPVKEEGWTLIHKLGLAIRVEKIDSQPKVAELPGSQEHELLGDLTAAGELHLRLRTPGDQIQPLGMDCMVRLKKFLHTHKSTKTLSFGGRVLVLANDTEVLWVPGCGMSQRIAVRNRATHRIQLLRISPDETSYC
jgi:tRNA(Ile)-lysidine synthase